MRSITGGPRPRNGLNARSHCTIRAGSHTQRMARPAIPPKAKTIVPFEDRAARLAVRPDIADIADIQASLRER
jgi:hypothetical protein